jgi:hypothetical protein
MFEVERRLEHLYPLSLEGSGNRPENRIILLDIDLVPQRSAL